MTVSQFRSITSLLLLTAISLELNHSLIQEVPWRGFEVAANLASLPLVATWAMAIGSLWTTKEVSTSWLMLGIFFLLMHGMVVSSAGNFWGLAYIGLGLSAAACMASAIQRESVHDQSNQEAPGRDQANFRIAS